MGGCLLRPLATAQHRVARPPAAPVPPLPGRWAHGELANHCHLLLLYKTYFELLLFITIGDYVLRVLDSYY